jgi:glycosyltransferase involved in cell wall biosynthesis
MRVVLVSARSPDEGAGAARLDRTAALLADAGHDVTVLARRWWDDEVAPTDGSDGEDGDGAAANGVEYVAVTGPTAPAWLFALLVPFFAFGARPDVVHVAAAPPLQVLAAKVAAVLARAPLVLDWYGDDPTDDGRVVDWAIRAADRVVVPSVVVGTWVRALGADGDDTEVVPEHVDMETVRSAPGLGDAEILYARDLDEHANLESLLLSLAELRQLDWTAAIIGDGTERERYEQQARDLRIADRVQFVGDQPLAERVARYRAGHVFVQTATRECFATDLLWALAAGCVGVVEYQADSSAHELVEHRDRGIRTTDDTELTEAIHEAAEMDDRDLDESFADHDGPAVAERWVACYERAAGDLGLV